MLAIDTYSCFSLFFGVAELQLTNPVGDEEEDSTVSQFSWNALDVWSVRMQVLAKNQVIHVKWKHLASNMF